MLNFQEQAANDLDAVFFNAPAKEFVTVHRIGGKSLPEHECEIIVDHERFDDRQLRANRSDNVNLNGLLFFIKKSVWLEKFKIIPKIDSEILFDEKRYLIQAVKDDMGVLEFTIEAFRGR